MKTEHSKTKAAWSQRKKILECLRENAGSFVSLKILTRVSGSANISGRISKLRQDNFHIVNKIQNRSHARLSSYKLC